MTLYDRVEDYPCPPRTRAHLDASRRRVLIRRRRLAPARLAAEQRAAVREVERLLRGEP